MSYTVKVLSPANIVEVETVCDEDDLIETVQMYKDDYMDTYGCTVEITPQI